jgi:hypothetical protein
MRRAQKRKVCRPVKIFVQLKAPEGQHIGDYRVPYEIEDDPVIIHRIEHRSRAYS